MGSVGHDGRFICSINGQISPKNYNEEDVVLRFVNARNSLQIIPHRKENQNYEKDLTQTNIESNESEKSLNKLCFSHNDCCEEKYLELRIGDAALRDQITVNFDLGYILNLKELELLKNNF